MELNRRTSLTAGVLFVAALLPVVPASAVTEDRRPVDLVICLDTSGSMTALIDSARAKIWDIVNDLSGAKPLPHLRVGLLTYGTPGNSRADEGWIVRQIDLTDDLDSVYAKMMGMTTSGGDEYVGWVLNDALYRMNWSRDPDALKIIFVAGNESADQASERYNFRYLAERARGGDIFVNAIYAGNRDQGISELWHEVASHGGGSYAAIDMVHGTMQIPTPQDDILMRLNSELNDTYVPYGPRGAAGQANQLAQDANAEKMGVQSCNSRAAAKSSGLYTNSLWDLIDACREDKSKLANLKDEDLPDDMRAMSQAERQAYVDRVQAARNEILEKMKKVSEERQQFLDAERDKQSDKTSLDDAIRDALRKQADSKGFTFTQIEAKAPASKEAPAKEDGC
ncbi:MAG: VWA domain-containing protein [Phycisphaerales bacterium]|nr:VWA domain-containing protein [Phycisphaerales bacterium]